MMSSSYSSGLVAAALFFLLFGCTQARTLVVGGKNNTWAVPSSASLNTWAEKARFVVGDTLVWKSEKEGDKVVEVKGKEEYDRCDASKAISSQSGLNASVLLDHSGPFYFISGSEENCKKGLKLTVVVLSEKHAGKVASPAPAPAPALDDLPAVPPTTGAAALSFSARAGFMEGLFLIYLFFWCV
ncbi:unnamed protein product [Cuscuta europaea]|uniref:Phytocyanin domain-containing protein n=1 Tax=Cuscuta europaea TaxID=41803 RepID=A0A9P0YVL0_CUSEU|nr:unnamed protein product [Cuscuta europaea]